MSDKQSGRAPQRKPSANRNIKKLRSVSMVCSLTSSWQQWVTEKETKQAAEPSGWSPESLGEPAQQPKRTWVPKRPLPTRTQATEASQEQSAATGEAVESSAQLEARDAAQAEELRISAEPPEAPLIKTKLVVKTVTSGAHERSAGIVLLTERIRKDALPSDEDIDRLLKKKRSPTCRRKCSNVVSSLTKSWNQVESEQKLGKEAAPEKGNTCTAEGEESGRSFDLPDPQTSMIISTREAEEKDSEGESESAIMIKRPSVPKYKKEAEQANKISTLSKKYSAVGSLKSRWQSWASEHTVNQRLNPFSEYFDYEYSMSLRLQKGQDGYGRPKEGTKTAERAKRAERHIHREIDDMCYVIRTMADPDRDGKTRVTFGQLFDRYVRISDKVVGILMRARKHGKVEFEGEMLWQGQDDGVIITLLV